MLVKGAPGLNLAITVLPAVQMFKLLNMLGNDIENWELS